MKNKFSLSLLTFLLMGSMSVMAETATNDSATEADAETDSALQMTAEELQEIKDICTSIADESGLKDEEHTQYVDECVSSETMVPTEDDATEEPAMEEPNLDEPSLEDPNLEEANVDTEEPSMEELDLEEPLMDEPLEEEPMEEPTDEGSANQS